MAALCKRHRLSKRQTACNSQQQRRNHRVLSSSWHILHRHLCPTAAETRPVSVCNMNLQTVAVGSLPVCADTYRKTLHKSMHFFHTFQILLAFAVDFQRHPSSAHALLDVSGLRTSMRSDAHLLRDLLWYCNRPSVTANCRAVKCKLQWLP